MKKQFAPKNTTRRNGGKKLNILAIELAACIILTAVLVGTVIGRYRRQFNSYGSVRALNFYFTSDFLDGGNHPIAPGTDKFTFNLGNHADDLRFSEMEINYTVTVERVVDPDTPADPTVTAPVIKITDEHGNVTDSSGTMTAKEKADHRVTISNLKPGDYTITAKAKGEASPATETAGYIKTLTATIQIPAEGAKLFRNTESYPDYIQLTIWNEGDREGTVSISYTGIPDNTNPNMTDWVRGTAVTESDIVIAPYSSKVFRFFGGDAKVVSVTDESGNNVANKTPQ